MADSGSPDDPEAFVSDFPLTAVFGTHPKTKILGAMLAPDGDPPTDFSASELSRIAGLDEGTVEEHVRDLEDVGIVVDTDELEEATYELAEDSAVVDDVRRLNEHLAELVYEADG